MMGIQQKQGALWAKAVDLSSRIPEDHVLDLGFVRDEVAGTNGKKGNVSIDPVVLMRLMLRSQTDLGRAGGELAGSL